jgi:hypothetical protein
MNTEIIEQPAIAATTEAQPGSLHPVVRPLVTLEEARYRWQRTMEILEKYPEARQFRALRKKWCAFHDRWEAAVAKAEALRERERLLWDEMHEMEKTLPAEVREALC